MRGQLRAVGQPVTGASLLEAARELIGPDDWPAFLQRRSFDLSRTIEGVRCRVNVLHTSRGVGLPCRLLAGFQFTLESLNLHPGLRQFTTPTHGLVLISGPTGSGKSTTLAALIQAINDTEARHIVTIENPIEYTFRPRRAFLRQREVGRDTPSFEQALLDSLREDPDVLMVGEMREPETMRLTLSAAETGHLVLATVHSGNCAEALQRIVSAFPAEIQNNVAAQLADSLVGVAAQRLVYLPQTNFLVPECEILTATTPVKTFIRNRDFFKIQNALETGAEHGMWTFTRYRTEHPSEEPISKPPPTNPPPREETTLTSRAPSIPVASLAPPQKPAARPAAPSTGRIEIEPPDQFEKILRRPD